LSKAAGHGLGLCEASFLISFKYWPENVSPSRREFKSKTTVTHYGLAATMMLQPRFAVVSMLFLLADLALLLPSQREP